MRVQTGLVVAVALALTGCSEDYMGFCEEIAMQYKTPSYDKFEITEVIDYTTMDQPRPEVYVRFTAMRDSGFVENRNVSCIFDIQANGIVAREIVVDGRKVPDDMLKQYNALAR